MSLASALDSSDSIDAITEYMEGLRKLIPQYPALQPVIEEYERWLTDLSWYARNITSSESLSNAKYYRDKANTITGDVLPADAVPADAAKAAMTASTKPTTPLIPTKYKFYAAGALGVGLLAFIGVKYVKAFLPSLPSREV